MQITDLLYLDSTGYHYSDFPTFLDFVKEQYRAIYGADVYLGNDSQDGQWVAEIAQSFYDQAALGSSNINSFSPLSAQGVGLSRLVKINGIKRRAATLSTVDVVIVGVASTAINNGVVQDTLNQKWNLPLSVVIPLSGTITVTATAQEVGATAAAATTVNKIFTPTLGWQTVNNPADATPGVAIEDDADLRIRQSQSTAIPSLTVFDGTIGAVENVTGVTKARGYENDTGSTDANGIPAHSISMIVQGGDALEIAQTIALHKGPGCGTYGTTSETVYDSHGMPSTIKFYRPTTKRIVVTVTITAFVSYSSAYAALIKQAVADSINAIGIGNNVLVTKLYVPANLPGTPQGDTYDVVSVLIAVYPSTPGAANIVIAFNELATCDVADITVIS